MDRNPALRLEGASRRRLPPESKAAEQSALRALMLPGSRDKRGEVIAALRSEYFFDPKHRAIFDAVRALHERGDPVDLVTVEHAVRDEVDNARLVLTGLREEAVTFDDGLHHARIVADLARDREAQWLVEKWLRNGAKAPQLVRMIEGLGQSESVSDADDADALDAFDFLAQCDDEYDWLIDGVLERTDRLLLTGREGYGKSYLAQQIAVQLAAGIHPFADAKQDPLTVLLVDLENPTREMRRRIRLFAHVAGERMQRGRLFVSSRPQGIDLAAEEDDRAWLRRRHEQSKPDLLVIGPLYKLSHADPNDERESKPVALFLDTLRTTFDNAVWLEAHMPHESKGRPFGWSGWRRWPDIGIELTETGLLKPWRPPRHETPLLPPALQRGGEWPWTVATRSRDALWARIVTTCEQRMTRPSVRDLADALGTGKSTVQRALDEHDDEWKAMFDE